MSVELYPVGSSWNTGQLRVYIVSWVGSLRLGGRTGRRFTSKYLLGSVLVFAVDRLSV